MCEFMVSFFLKNFIYLILTMMVLYCCTGFFPLSIVESKGYFLAVVHGLHTTMVSLLVEHGL